MGDKSSPIYYLSPVGQAQQTYKNGSVQRPITKMSQTHCLFGNKLLTYFKIILLVDFNGGKESRKGEKERYRVTILKAIMFQISWEEKVDLTKLHFITSLGYFNSQVVVE